VRYRQLSGLCDIVAKPGGQRLRVECNRTVDVST
jgi:hypothetical protein